jgi:hypothetical protein
MGWSISHGGTRHGYSYGSVAELRTKLEKAAPQESATFSLVLNRGSGDPFTVNADTAQSVGWALLRAADRLKIWDRKWAAMARQIGDSALLSARLGEPWRWS